MIQNPNTDETTGYINGKEKIFEYLAVDLQLCHNKSLLWRRPEKAFIYTYTFSFFSFIFNSLSLAITSLTALPESSFFKI